MKTTPLSPDTGESYHSLLLVYQDLYRLFLPIPHKRSTAPSFHPAALPVSADLSHRKFENVSVPSVYESTSQHPMEYVLMDLPGPMASPGDTDGSPCDVPLNLFSTSALRPELLGRWPASQQGVHTASGQACRAPVSKTELQRPTARGTYQNHWQASRSGPTPSSQRDNLPSATYQTRPSTFRLQSADIIEEEPSTKEECQ